MESSNFANLPTEILEHVCRELVADELDAGARRGLLSLSRVSRRFRTIAIPDMFREISPILLDPHELSRPAPYTSFIGLLRTFITNPGIAAEVRDIVTYPLGRRRMSPEDFAIISTRAADMGITVPASVYPEACKAAAERTLWTEAAGLEDGEASQFLAEMIMAHTPNVRSIDYRVCNENTFFDTFSAAPSRQPPDSRPLLASLEDFRIENLGPANRALPIAKAAPDLDSMWLDGVHGPVTGLCHDRVRVLLLTTAMLLTDEVKDLVLGFPGVRKLFVSWTSWSLVSPVSDRPWCSPRQAVDALGPIAAQLTDLTMRFFHWYRYSLDEPRTEPLAECVSSFRSLEALERLDVDAVTLYDPKHELYERTMYNAKTARRFERMLPRSLKILVLDNMMPGPIDDDLLVFASAVKESCPLLQRIDYQRVPRRRERLPSGQVEELRELFGKQGVAFEDLTDESFAPVSWRRERGDED
ncbi:F-box domain protein [Colletotrichum musicola]|uniref:F-box domain protein n=1 Tax=Colletotrichum musicola TaxID=2175873 RepID=A0A8H6JT47_9PEZI|nr:F-box domain protein [Colletotrichum musicola]